MFSSSIPIINNIHSSLRNLGQFILTQFIVWNNLQYVPKKIKRHVDPDFIEKILMSPTKLNGITVRYKIFSKNANHSQIINFKSWSAALFSSWQSKG